MLSFRVSNPLGSGIPPAAEIRDSPIYIMRVGREQMDQALIEHAIGPILRIPPESASDRTGCDLHPDPVGSQAADRIVLLIDPGKASRVG